MSELWRGKRHGGAVAPRIAGYCLKHKAYRDEAASAKRFCWFCKHFQLGRTK